MHFSKFSSVFFHMTCPKYVCFLAITELFYPLVNLLHSLYSRQVIHSIVKNRKCLYVTCHCRKARPYTADLSWVSNVPVVTVNSEKNSLRKTAETVEQILPDPAQRTDKKKLQYPVYTRKFALRALLGLQQASSCRRSINRASCSTFDFDSKCSGLAAGLVGDLDLVQSCLVGSNVLERQSAVPGVRGGCGLDPARGQRCAVEEPFHARVRVGGKVHVDSQARTGPTALNLVVTLVVFQHRQFCTKHTPWSIKRCHLYFSNSSAKHWPILIIFGIQTSEKTLRKWM